ncbi:MAG: AbrB/MazE/SpoVT family DNA-binding domain-containing protein [Alphaproteobacteria bacterium]|nr:AbrB/MazE/SpoVT family DNA-binding domain-containing protein [Alphaproteobacteria bacterium]
MSLVTIKPKFQVTIPATLRARIDLHEGDLLEATLVEGGILLRPKVVVDRGAAADRIAAVLAATPPADEDRGRDEDEILRDIDADVAARRAEKRMRRG